MDSNNVITLLLILGLCGLLLFLYFKFFKIPKLKSIVFIDGTLGSGKSFYSVCLAIRLHKKAVRQWKVRTFFQRLLKKPLDEKPLLYSNILLRNYPFVKVTKELMFRKDFRFAYKSVLLLDEFSLVADQMLYKDAEINERLSLFFKLFRHETKNGKIVINSQSTCDLHYSLKYVLSDYFYIHSKTTLPFISILRVQELGYNADKNGTTMTLQGEGDIEDCTKLILVFNKYFKYYDSYCYSIFTDDLPVYAHKRLIGKKGNLKDVDLVSFKDFNYLKENLKNEKK